MIKTIFVDYAGVLTPSRDFAIFAKKYAKHFGMNCDDFVKLMFLNWDSAVIGKIPSSVYWNGIAKILKIKGSEFRQILLKTFPADVDVINFLKEIKGRATLVMVSNQIEDWINDVIKENDLDKIFDYYSNSYQAGFRKPDPRIFRYALKISDSKPKETLVIDDNTENVSAAEKLGIRGYVFRDSVKGLRYLKKAFLI